MLLRLRPLAAIRVLPQSAPLVPYHAAQVLLGVVASDVRLAVRSLRDYCQSLGLPFRVRSGAPQLLLLLYLPPCWAGGAGGVASWLAAGQAHQPGMQGSHGWA